MEYPYTKNVDYSTEGENNQHVFASYELYYPEKKEEFIEYLIPVLKEEYGTGIDFNEKTKNIADQQRIATLNKFILRNNTPNPDIKPAKEQLSVTRNKISEIIAKDILEKINNVMFVCRASLEEEEADMPKRGVDNFGFVFEQTDDKIILKNIVVCEVKASDSSKSPPAVVNDTDDCLYKSLLGMKNLNVKLEKALTKSLDKLQNDKYFSLLADIAIDLENKSSLELIQQKILLVPFLFRQTEKYTKKDFEEFNKEYKNFEPATIMYYIIMIDNDLKKFGDDIFRRLREG